MKKLRKVLALVLAMVMVLAMNVSVFAQTVDSGKGGSGSITITNAAVGESYSVYKLFDAKVDPNTGAITYYTDAIPASLATYFTLNSTKGTIEVTEAGKSGDGLSEAAVTALKAWASAQATATYGPTKAEESTLVFDKLQYGYYVVTSTQASGTAISVTSTNPNPEIIDKNTTTPIGDLKKTSDKDEKGGKIGESVTYTVKFTTANYVGVDQITEYIITDELPAGVTLDSVTSITIDNVDYKVNGKTPQFDVNGKITIPWVNGDNNIYANGAKIVVTYTATLNKDAVIAGDGNKNKVTVNYNTRNSNGGKETTTDTVYTYALAIKKVNSAGTGLQGATFQLPFYVVANADGTYTVATQSTANATNSVTTPEDGVIIIKGVSAGDYTITETAAPEGYNKLAAPFTATAVKSTEKGTNTTIYLDKNGNVVEKMVEDGTTVTYSNTQIAASVVPVLNLSGAQLPSTGGMGTTLFYVFGAVLVIGAGIVLVTRRRMAK